MVSYVIILFLIVAIFLLLREVTGGYEKELGGGSLKEEFIKFLSTEKLENKKMKLEILMGLLLEKYTNNTTPKIFEPELYEVVSEDEVTYKITTEKSTYVLTFPKQRGVTAYLEAVEKTDDDTTFCKNIDIAEFICEVKSADCKIRFGSDDEGKINKEQISKYVDFILTQIFTEDDIYEFTNDVNNSSETNLITMRFKNK